MKKTILRWPVLACAGIVAGMLLTYSIGFFYVLLLVIGIALYIRRSYGEEEARTLIKLFIWLFALRVLVVLILRPFAILSFNGIDIFGDSAAYNINGFLIAESLKTDLTLRLNQVPLNKFILNVFSLPHLKIYSIVWILPRWIGTLPPVNLYQVTGYTYYLAFLYYFFGFKPIIPLFINCACGALASVLVYYLTKRLSGNNKAALIAAVICGFFPTIFLWSVVSLRDIFMINLTLLMLIVSLKVIEDRRYWYLILLGITATSLFLLGNDFIFLFTIFFCVLAVIFMIKLVYKKKLPLMLFLLLLVVAQIIPASRTALDKLKKPLITKTYESTLSLLVRHRTQVLEGGVCYRILNDQYYSQRSLDSLRPLKFRGFLKAVSLGVIHFFFEPLPFRFNLIWIPEFFLLVFLSVFFCTGAYLSFKQNPQATIFVITFFAITSGILAMSEGNIGTMLRHRDIVTPLYIVFSSIGIAGCFFRRKRAKANKRWTL